MNDGLLTIFHVAVVVAKLLGPGGVRAVVAENGSVTRLSQDLSVRT